MDDVAVSSLRVFPEASCQATIRATACSMRVLLRLGPLAAIEGTCSFTGGALRGRASYTRRRSSGETKTPRANQKAARGERLANRELGTPNLGFHRKYTANSGSWEAQFGRADIYLAVSSYFITKKPFKHHLTCLK